MSQRKIIIIMIVMVLLMGITFTTYAYFGARVISGTINSTSVTTGGLNISISDSSVAISNFAPIYDENYKTEAYKKEFSLISSADSLNACTKILINVTNISTSLKSQYFKWKLVDEFGNEHNGNFAGYTSGDFLVVQNEFLKTSQTINYTLYIWISSADGVDQTNMLGTQFSGNVKIEANDTKLRTACKQTGTLKEVMFADNIPASDTGVNFGASSSASNGLGLMYTSDLTKTEDINADGEGERVFYYRGNVDNNFVAIGPYCFRIIRTNEDGSTRMIYSGSYQNNSCYSTASSISISNAKYNIVRTDNAYVGFMFGETAASNYNQTHANTNSSNAKIVLDAWYTGNSTSNSECGGNNCTFSSITDPLSNYSNVIENTLFCNDRSITAGTGVGTNTTTTYSAMGRITSSTPQYKCPQQNDKFTLSVGNGGTLGYGNNALTNPVGLITADELMYAGIIYGTGDVNNYLYFGYWAWTMTPYRYTSSGAKNVRIGDVAEMGDNYVHGNYGIYPVISLKSNASVTSGTGKINNPYLVD